MTKLKTVYCFISTPYEGSMYEEEVETDYTEEQWAELSNGDREDALERYYQEFKSNYLDGGCFEEGKVAQ